MIAEFRTQKESENLSERLLGFGAGVVRFADKAGRTAAAQHITRQLVRSATSSGANYQEARAAESRADFVHTMQLVLKELRESLYSL